MTFDSLGLRAELLRALGDAGYTTPTPVQAQAIPVILEGRDILAGAQTGTGKTAGFTLPLLHRLSQTPARVNNSSARRPVRSLILTPTRELAAQVEESVRTYGKYLPLTAAVVFGGVNINPQIAALRRGVDILVATPGRLLDHVQQRTVDLSRVEILVLDEADRMLDMGFIRDIKKILALLPPGTGRQNLLFSATFSNEIKALADSLLNAPTLVEVARRNQESELVTQSVYFAHKESKRDLLVHLLSTEKVGQALVFTRTKHGADRLVKQLVQDGVSAVPIHGNRSQSQRTKALADFKAGSTRILVATDIAARGLDIEQLPHVFNYELPNVPEDYVHRIGRTGRAGSTGEAISLVAGDEQSYLADIEKLIKKRIDRREASGFIPRTRAETPALPQVQRPRGGYGGNGRFASQRPEGQASAAPRAPMAPRPPRPGNFAGAGNGNGGPQRRRPATPFTRQSSNA
ncbi:MAG: DEAD/DEAH box helicase [Armatimonadota bacterium]